MIEPLANYAIEHVVALVAGGVALLGALVFRSYGRRLERQTLARGEHPIDHG